MPLRKREKEKDKWHKEEATWAIKVHKSKKEETSFLKWLYARPYPSSLSSAWLGTFHVRVRMRSRHSRRRLAEKHNGKNKNPISDTIHTTIKKVFWEAMVLWCLWCDAWLLTPFALQRQNDSNQNDGGIFQLLLLRMNASRERSFAGRRPLVSSFDIFRQWPLSLYQSTAMIVMIVDGTTLWLRFAKELGRDAITLEESHWKINLTMTLPMYSPGGKQSLERFGTQRQIYLSFI